MLKKKKELIKMIMLQIIFQIVIIICPLLLPNCVNKIMIEIFETFSGKKWEITMFGKVIFCIFLWIMIFLLNRKFNEEFLKGDIYGSKYIIWYWIAKALGYNKISLIRKPYNIIFNIVKKKMFEIIPDEIEEDDVEAYIDFSNFKNLRNLRECNLIISDTYEIKMEQIPESKRNLATIYVYRDKSEMVNNRVYSSKFLAKIGDAFKKVEETGAVINLFLTTNTRTTKEMVEKILMKGQRSTYKIKIFLQEDSGIRMFSDNGIKIVI